jgi:hypothetical protein
MNGSSDERPVSAGADDGSGEPGFDDRVRRNARAMLADTLRARAAAEQMLAANAAIRARLARHFARR